MNPSTRRFEQLAGYCVLLLIAIGCFVILQPFLAALLWATILSISTWPAFRWLERVLGGRTTLAAALMTILLGLALLVPMALLGTSLADNFARFAGQMLSVFETGPPPPPPWVAELPYFGPQLAETWHYFADDTTRFADTVREYVGPATQWLLGLGTKLGGGVLDLTLSVVAAFFFFRDGAHGAKRLKVMLEKVAGSRGDRLLSVAELTISGVVYGMLGTALAQGALAAFGLWLAGVPGALFLGVMTSLLSFVPMGPPMVWLPSTLWLFSTGEITWGIFMGLWGVLRRQHRRQHHTPLLHQPGQRAAAASGVLGRSGRYRCVRIARRLHRPDPARGRLYPDPRMEPHQGVRSCRSQHLRRYTGARGQQEATVT